MLEESVVSAALASLTGARHAHVDAVGLVPREPGLYAFYGDDRAWSQLELTSAFDDQPLYVGKAERSLNGRDVRTHFAAGKTGSSTVRRSLAALLAHSLGLVAVPRNLDRPDGSANFGLDAASETRLSEWMERRLRLAIWVKDGDVDLDDVETAVVRQLRPPLNVAKTGQSRAALRAARRQMADAARAWRPDPRRTTPSTPATHERRG